MYTGGDETCVERFILSAPSTRNHSYTGWHATRPDDKAYAVGKGCFFIFWGFLMWGKKPEWSAPGVLLLLQRHRRDSRAGSLPP